MSDTVKLSITAESLKLDWDMREAKAQKIRNANASKNAKAIALATMYSEYAEERTVNGWLDIPNMGLLTLGKDIVIDDPQDVEDCVTILRWNGFKVSILEYGTNGTNESNPVPYKMSWGGDE